MTWRERAGDWLTSWVDRLPPELRRLVPRSLAGFAIIGGFTFLIDLGLLWLLRDRVGLPVPVAVTLGYGVAFGLNFVLNRTINFRSHAPVGRQAVRYALVVACDFGLTLGVTTGLTELGLDFRLARLIAATCVAAFTYSASRWWVFRDALGSDSGSGGGSSGGGNDDDAGHGRPVELAAGDTHLGPDAHRAD